MHPGFAHSPLSSPRKKTHYHNGDGWRLDAAVPRSTFPLVPYFTSSTSSEMARARLRPGGPSGGRNHIVALHFWRPLDWSCTQEGLLQLDEYTAVIYSRGVCSGQESEESLCLLIALGKPGTTLVSTAELRLETV